MNNFASNQRTTILHITADYPDCFDPNKTLAVKSLVSSSDLNSIVISLNRISTFNESVSINENLIAIRYFAPPYGLGLRFFLKRLSHKISKILDRERIDYDLLHAHKFSVEGVIAYYLKCRNKKPYIASLWGSTDRKIIALKPECRRLFRLVAYQSEALLPAAPWMSKWAEKRLRLSNSGVKFMPLPIITRNTSQLNHAPARQPFKLVSVFNLDLYKLKGLPKLLAALANIQSVTLDIYGDGSTKRKIIELIEKHQLSNRVSLHGYIDNALVIETMSQYNAFVMPTTSETFGMVFIEALSSGIPIIYSEEQGIDGYFDGLNIGARVAPENIESISEGITHVIQHYDLIKANVGFLQNDGYLNQFKQQSIAVRYATITNTILRNLKRS